MDDLYSDLKQLIIFFNTYLSTTLPSPFKKLNLKGGEHVPYDLLLERSKHFKIGFHYQCTKLRFYFVDLASAFPCEFKFVPFPCSY